MGRFRAQLAHVTAVTLPEWTDREGDAEERVVCERAAAVPQAESGPRAMMPALAGGLRGAVTSPASVRSIYDVGDPRGVTKLV